MTVRFADTSVPLHSISGGPAEHGKAARANEILETGDIGLSVQVLQVLYVQATRSQPDGRDRA